MKKLKHSKYRNTGIIFEILSRGIVNEALHNKPSTSLNIVNKYFKKNSQIHKEYKFYQTLQEINSKIKNTDKLIDIVLETYNSQIDINQLKKEKYQLIGEIKKHYTLDEFFGSRISNYRLLASIYKLLEYSPSENPSDHVNCREFVSEHIAGKSKDDNIISEAQKLWESTDPDIKKLAYKIIVDKFNQKYNGLNESQKELLAKIIQEDTSSPKFKDYVYNQLSILEEKLTKIANKLSDNVLKIKLTEAIHLMEKIVSSNTIKDEHLSSILKYHELVETLNGRIK